MGFSEGGAGSGFEPRGSVEREIAGFFKGHPFLLVSEERLASLLCRPLDMVIEAVREMEEAGLLSRRGEETLLGIDENLAKVEIET